VITSSMIKVATVGVHDQMENMTGSEDIPRNLMSKAAPTARHSTSTEKMAALLVSVSFVNITQYPFSRRRSGGVCPRPRFLGDWWNPKASRVASHQ
jgi:hypothetical protein